MPDPADPAQETAVVVLPAAFATGNRVHAIIEGVLVVPAKLYERQISMNPGPPLLPHT